MRNSKLLDDTVRIAPGLHAVPVVHGSAEYTVFIRKLILESPPRYLAVELPENMAPYIERCIPYADSIPVISTVPENESDLQVHFIMEPLEPIVEAVRSAYEFGIPVFCTDVYSEYLRDFVRDAFPDTYALNVTGVRGMYEEYLKSAAKAAGNQNGNFHFNDDAREIKMARDLRRLYSLSSGENGDLPEILFVCGIKHLKNIIRYFSMSEEEFSSYLPLIADQASDGPGSPDAEPLEAVLRNKETAMKGPEFSISVLSEESPEVLHQPGYYNTAWLTVRKHPQYIDTFSRISLQRRAYREAVNRYEKESGEMIAPQIQKFFFRFARNWSILENHLLPDLYKLVITARNFHNDNFARIFHDILNQLPPRGPVSFPEKTLTLDDLYRDSKLIRFRLKRKIRRKVPPPKIRKRFRKERYPGEWKEGILDNSICSYPPEDIIIEDFGRYLQRKAKSMISGNDRKIVPFTSSLLDGIDYRETVRNLHLNKIFVKDLINRTIDAGSVVIIFSEDTQEHSWEMVWWGEHDQESDMAFYATPIGEHMAGPGIYRCHYGGLLMTYPPGRLHDIWQDDYYEHFTNPADRLLAAAIEFNSRNAVVHLSNRPPLPQLVFAAARAGQRIIHIPLSSVPPVRLGRVRRFHVLDSKERRDEAGDYIW